MFRRRDHDQRNVAALVAVGWTRRRATQGRSLNAWTPIEISNRADARGNDIKLSEDADGSKYTVTVAKSGHEKTFQTTAN